MTTNPWLFDESQLNLTPSAREGLTKSTERSLRIEGARFIQRLGNRELNLHISTVATGSVYFHRFYMCHSFKKFPIYPMAAACLFLAGKAEETPKKSNDIVKVCRNILDESDFATFQASGLEPKEELLTLERILLQTLRFDLEVEHPYEYLLKYVNQLQIERRPDETPAVIKREIIQATWTFLNDSCCTTICLQYEPEIIAMAMLLLSCKVGKYRVVNWEKREQHQLNWWDVYVENLDEYRLEEICHDLLDVYQDQKQPNVLPQASYISNPATPNSQLYQQQQTTSPPTAQPASVVSTATVPPVMPVPPPLLPHPSLIPPPPPPNDPDN